MDVVINSTANRRYFMYHFIRDLLMHLHYYTFKLDLDVNVWFHEKACYVQDRYID